MKQTLGFNSTSAASDVLKNSQTNPPVVSSSRDFSVPPKGDCQADRAMAVLNLEQVFHDGSRIRTMGRPLKAAHLQVP
eukprot:5219625-Amphidinium_carterae.1